MTGKRRQILEWAAQGRIPQASLPLALRLAGTTPNAADWRRFGDLLALWLGALLLAAALIFFLAYNWHGLGRYAKFGLAETALLGSAALAWRFGLERTAGRAALLTAALATGALLALVGQTYQTGADGWELFGGWAVAILPWAGVGRSPALWLLWIGLLNLAAYLYHQSFGGLFRFVFDWNGLLWLLFGLNAAILAGWELAAGHGGSWLQTRWLPRILALSAAGPITLLALVAIIEESRSLNGLAGQALWLAAMYCVYRHIRLDVFMLSVAVLSAIIVIAALLGRALPDGGDEIPGLFIIALAVLGLTSAAGWWLKSLVAEADA